MKHSFIIYFFCIILGAKAKSQNLSVELSIVWKNADLNENIPPLRADTIKIVPFLKVTYRNFTNKDIYFKNPIPVRNNYPHIVSSSTIGNSMNLTDVVINKTLKNSFSRESYNVYLWQGVWETLNRETNPFEEHEGDIINNYLSIINNIFQMQESLDQHNIKKQLFLFDYPDKEVVSVKEAQNIINQMRENEHSESLYLLHGVLTKRNIIEKYRKEFVFLRQGEVSEKYINLIGFYLVAGNFNFMFTDTVIENNLQINKNQKIYFPKKVEGYNLFSGGFKTNSVGIKF